MLRKIEAILVTKPSVIRVSARPFHSPSTYTYVIWSIWQLTTELYRNYSSQQTAFSKIFELAFYFKVLIFRVSVLYSAQIIISRVLDFTKKKLRLISIREFETWRDPDYG
jgi:hypothetical protein